MIDKTTIFYQLLGLKEGSYLIWGIFPLGQYELRVEKQIVAAWIATGDPG